MDSTIIHIMYTKKAEIKHKKFINFIPYLKKMLNSIVCIYIILNFFIELSRVYGKHDTMRYIDIRNERSKTIKEKIIEHQFEQLPTFLRKIYIMIVKMRLSFLLSIFQQENITSSFTY